MTIRTATVLVSILTTLAGGFVAVGSSYASLQPYAKRSGRAVSPTASLPVPSASPSLPAIARGRLGIHPRLVPSGGVLLAFGDDGLYESDDGGATFKPLSLPAGASGLVVATSNPRRRLTGGTSIRVTDDGGNSWHLPATAPPGPGPFTPVAVNPTDPDVWFAMAHGRLLRTRDGGISWRELAGISADASALMVPTGRPDEFVLSAGGQVYGLTNNGQQIRPRSSLPGGVQPTELVVAANDPAIALLARGSDGKDYFDSGEGWHASVPLGGPVAAVPGKWMIVADASSGAVPAQAEVSTDLGTSWTVGRGLPNDESVDALGSAPGSGVVYGYSYGGSVLKTADGANWMIVGGAFRS